jgi:Na+-transporting NADH:ubiquinone oxidoreductase subunit NqrF
MQDEIIQKQEKIQFYEEKYDNLDQQLKEFSDLVPQSDILKKENFELKQINLELEKQILNVKYNDDSASIID